MSNLATILVTVITLITLAVLFDPSKPKPYNREGGRLHLPPVVPWSFIFLRFRKIPSLLYDIQRHYGELVSIHIPFKGTFVLAVGKNSSKWFFNSPTKDLHDLGAIINQWIPKFPEHLSPVESNKLIQRSLTNQFYENIIRSFQMNLHDRIAEWAEASQNGWSFDALTEGSKLVLDINAKVILGDDWDPKEFARFKKAFLICEPFVWASNIVYLTFPFLGHKKRNEANKVLVETVTCHAQKHLDKGLEPNKFSLDFFLSEKSLGEAACQSWALLISSYTTTSFTFSWLLYHLAADKELQQRVRAEIDSIVPKGVKQLKQEHLSKMHLMDSITREIVRMHHHGPMGRCAMADLKVGEFDIPKGSIVTMPFASIHFSEDNFEQATVFKADRFLNEDGEFDTGDKVRTCKLLVFGAGRHPCLGMRLAATELKVFAYELISKYDLILANNPPKPVVIGMGFENPATRFQVTPRSPKRAH
ncbi:cytochrome P450 [Cladochytrium replicatum]|nr:cytochrome P450 [Cladochytrium replicatum]